MESICRLYVYSTDGQFKMTDVEGSVECTSDEIKLVELTSAEDETVVSSLSEGSTITCRTATGEYLSGSIKDIALTNTEDAQITCNSVDLGEIQSVPFAQKSLQLQSN